MPNGKPKSSSAAAKPTNYSDTTTKTERPNKDEKSWTHTTQSGRINSACHVS